MLRARIIGLHHFLMLFMMMAFSVLFDCVKAPGLGLGVRYMFTMAVGRLLRAITFASTILPSARPWCAAARFRVPAYPHRWAQKYYVPYASDSNAISQIINLDTDAYGGFSSALIWVLLLHSAQREIRERHHYSVDCIVAINVGILLWKMTGFLWPAKDSSKARRLAKLEKIQSKLIHAAKDSNIDEVRELLEEVELGGQEGMKSRAPSKAMWVFPCVTIFSAIVIVLLAFTWTSDG